MIQQLNSVSEASVWVLQLLFTLRHAVFLGNMEMETYTPLTLVPLLGLVAGFPVRGLTFVV